MQPRAVSKLSRSLKSYRMPQPPIALLTDFGDAAGYVAQMKGVILGINPQAVLVDVTHTISPQSVREASLVLDSVIDAFPPGTLFVAVVDPGVGSDRGLIGVETRRHRFLAPDNGLLGETLARDRPIRIHRLAESRYWRPDVSRTFHGRDILAPVAGHWNLGVDLALFGPAIEAAELVEPVAAQPSCVEGRVIGQIIAVDRFGNLVSNIREMHLPAAKREKARVYFGDNSILGIGRFYSERPEGALLSLFGSSGRLEVAVNGGSAAARFGVHPGTSLIVDFEKE